MTRPFLAPVVANMLFFTLFCPLMFGRAPVSAQSSAEAAAADHAATKTALVMALASAPTTLDSRFATGASASRIADLLSRPLVELDTSFQPQPAAAKKFTWVNDTTLEFTLKKMAFVDGQPLTAGAVKRFYQSMQSPETVSPYKGQLKPIKRIEAVGKRKIRFVFSAPTPFVWPLFSHPIMRPDAGLGGADSAKRPIGLGPYRVKQGSTLEDLTLEQALEHTPAWQGKEPASPRLRFKTVKDPLVRLLKVQEGEAHLLQNDMPAVFYHHARKLQQQNNTFKTMSAPSTNYTYLGFNLADGVTKKLALRKAIAHALNRQKIMDTLLFGLASPAKSILPQSHKAFWPAPLRPHDPQKATQLLEEAGFEPDKNGVRVRLRFSTTNNPSTMLLVQAIQHQLRQVGIELETNVSEWGTFYGNILKGNFQMYLLTWVGVFDADIYKSLFHSEKKPPDGANRGRFDNGKMDTLIDKLWQPNANKTEVTRNIQKLQHQRLPYVSLWQRHNIAIMHPNVRGFTLTPDGSYKGLLNTYVAQQ